MLNNNNNFDTNETCRFLYYCMCKGEKNIEIISEHDDRFADKRVTEGSFNCNDKRLPIKARYLKETQFMPPTDDYNDRLATFVYNLNNVTIRPLILREIEEILREIEEILGIKLDKRNGRFEI